MSTTAVPTDLLEKLIRIRRELHRRPELGNEESGTARLVCRYLDELGLSYRSGVAGHGVVAEIPGRADGPMVALRAELDALPIQEETGLDFSSEVPGVMHACGHDGHMTMLLGAAELLCNGDPPPLTVRLVFQPAEELGSGAQEMMEAGALEDVAMIFAGHLDRHYPTGTIVVTPGTVNAATDAFNIEIRGQGGHGARPHESTDSVVVGSLMVMAIQTLVSREVDPAFPSVVSVGQFTAGTAPNAIAGEAFLAGTIRAQHPDVREQLKAGVARIATSIAELHGAEVSIDLKSGTPPLTNTREMTRLARKAAAEVVGRDNVSRLRIANMGGEDFAYFLERVPGCYVRFGSQVPGRQGFPAHSSRFDFDEDALPTGAAFLAAVARKAGESVLARREA
jgi:hippurate hydrolase